MMTMRLRQPGLLLIAVITAFAVVCVAEDAGTRFTPLAQSAQVLIEGARTPEGLTLRFERTTGGTALPVSELSATLDGKSLPLTRAADGTWKVPLPSATPAGKLELQVGHDGIRELLSGAPPAPVAAAAPAEAPGASHKQIWWWVLNIGIVLVAVIAVSRRMS
jgi:hypothetical protein